jgi:geranylgeranyl diphosphate synthase type II
MEFTEYTAKHADKIYNKIKEYIPNREPKEHYEWVAEYTNRRGKYGRPGLIVLWCELYGGKVEDAILPAATMQASEDWILVHDDWQDGNSLRRGKPTLHKIAGDYFAVNAGDAMHMVNWKMAHDAAKKLGQRGEEFYNRFYQMLLVTAEGQYYDMDLTKRVKDIRKFSLDDYYRSISAKTPYYTVYGPMQFGAIVAGKGSDKELDKIKEYGYPLGVAFQIKDDILDCTADEKVFGKSIGTDVYEGVKTAILWHFVRNAKEGDVRKVEAIYKKDRKDKTPADVKTVIDLFVQNGSIEFAKEKMEEFGNQALKKFEENTKNIPEGEIKKTARDAIHHMVKRIK